MSLSHKIREQRPSKSPRVLIVGAGIAGLRCADVLLQIGFDVNIWEARDRVGGRMHQTKLPSGATVDLGPNWIHGTDNNPILNIARQTGTATQHWDDTINVLDENGHRLTNGSQLWETLWRIISKAFKYSSENTASIDAGVSLYDFFVDSVNEFIPDGNESARQRDLILQLASFWGAYVGSPVTQQSLKYFWLEETIDGENLFCAGTYEKILETIAKPALERANIKYLTKLVLVDSRDHRVRVRNDEQVEEEFDEVIVTSPLGWLKRNNAAFVPQLPDRFRQAIENIGYGSLEKVYLTFPRSFWVDKGAAPDETSKGFTYFSAPSYALDTNPNRWSQESVDLSTLPKGCAHPTLLFYLYGDQSKTFAADLESMLSDEARQEYLTQFFKPYFSKLPNYAENLPDCVPTSCLATSWVLDELAGYGSYTTFRTGLQEGDKDIETMRDGLPERGLWFAGEHTAPFIALGTVTGAYLAGEGIGNRIAKAYGMTSGKAVSMDARMEVWNIPAAFCTLLSTVEFAAA